MLLNEVVDGGTNYRCSRFYNFDSGKFINLSTNKTFDVALL